MTTPDLSAALWRKSTYSNGSGGACVEVVRNLPAPVAVRDSKAPAKRPLSFPSSAWRAFTGSLRNT